MIVETGREAQGLGSDVLGYLEIIGISPSTFGFWAREAAAGALMDPPPRPPTAEELKLLSDIRMEMKDLIHRRHYTYGLGPLWAEYRGKISRERFRDLAREVRREVNRDRRKNMLRYEFTNPDVAHSLDFKGLPKELWSGGRRYMIRILDDCTRCTIRKAVTEHKGAGVGTAYVSEHLKAGPRPYVFKYDLEFDTAQFENLLLLYKVVPLPNPPHAPWTNGKNERANKDVQLWFAEFGQDQTWTTEEMALELDICIGHLDEVEERDILNGKTRRQAYDKMERARVDRDGFYNDAVAFRSALLRRPDNKLTPTAAWRKRS